MKKNFLPFVTSYLLLAAFIGTAEATKIQLAAVPPSSAADPGFTLDGQTGGMEWLLTLNYETEAEILLIDLEKAPEDSTDEGLPTGEEDEYFPLAPEMWLAYNFADLAYGDRLFTQTDGGPITPIQPTATGLASEKKPIFSYGTIPISFYDPPRVVRIEESNSPQQLPPDDRSHDPNDSPKKPKPAGDLPQVISDPLVGGPLSPPTPERRHEKPEKPKKNPHNPKSGAVPIPDNVANSPAPVPEPATMLLVSTGIMGLAFRRWRKN